ncbi:MAG: MBL fold metallo-hydrolase [Armatimonadota bacterium]|nr:MBL fold metallo-hydrolase [Armatimonadota bacterium]
MRIQILGTAAAEGWPAVFCACETCERARHAGEKNIRTRQSVQIDEVYKIDLPPDTHYQQFRFALRLSRLKHLFVTHSHEDHLAINELHYLRPPFAHNLENPPIKVYGNPTVIQLIEALLAKAQLPLETVSLEPFKPVQADHLTVFPVPGSHISTEMCLTYVVCSNGGTVLFAWDTGMYSDTSLSFLQNFRFDAVIAECTQGTLDMPSTSHMGLRGVISLRDSLAHSGAVDSNTRFVLTHFSHNIGLLHEELVEITAPYGMEVAWDGMVLEIGPNT